MIKYFKPFVFILCLLPLGIIILDIYYNNLGAEPVKKIMNHFGEWTLIFICLTLTMSPLKRITNLGFWIKFRRMLGLFVFFYATIHLLTYVGLDYRFDWEPIINDVLKKKYILSLAHSKSEHKSSDTHGISCTSVLLGAYIFVFIVFYFL